MPEKLDLVVIGLGYVGLPLAREACGAGLKVCGFDTSGAVVEALQRGHSHVDDVSDADVARMLMQGFLPSSTEDVLGLADTIVICVPTPLTPEGGPDLRAVRAATEAISRQLTAGQLVVLESTSYPGTTEEFVAPILEQSGLVAGRDFDLAFSPERIDPGNPRFSIRNTPKVVGGITPHATQRTASFYGKFVDEVVCAKGPKEAELTKLLENTYRHINIAFMNEMLKLGHELEIDVWDAIECAKSKPFGFETFYPGPGVGGHCIPIDPRYLSHRVQSRLGQPFRLVELAQEINEGMPAYVVRRAQDLLNASGRSVNGAHIVLLGVTYKRNIADQRESPAISVASNLLALGANLSFVDPYVDDWRVDEQVITRVSSICDESDLTDLAILLQYHDDFRELALPKSVAVLDTRGVLSGPNIVRL